MTRYIGDRGLSQATEASCAEIRIFYAAPHTHAQETNIPQHSQCGENRVYHMETGAESNADG